MIRKQSGAFSKLPGSPPVAKIGSYGGGEEDFTIGFKSLPKLSRSDYAMQYRGIESVLLRPREPEDPEPGVYTTQPKDEDKSAVNGKTFHYVVVSLDQRLDVTARQEAELSRALFLF